MKYGIIDVTTGHFLDSSGYFISTDPEYIYTFNSWQSAMITLIAAGMHDPSIDAMLEVIEIPDGKK